MTFLQTNGVTRSFRHRGACVLVLTAALLLGLAGVVLTPTPAAAAAFSIDPPSLDPFPSSTVTITGTKDLDATVRVPSFGDGDPYCIEARAQETWSCTFDIADGEYDVTVIEDAATDPPTSSEAQVRVRVLGAPELATVGVTTGMIAGTGFPGAVIVVSATGPESFSEYHCTNVQSPGGYWSCPLPITASGEYTLTVGQGWPGTGNLGGTMTRTIVVDKQPPPLPIVTQPSAGEGITSQPTLFAGTGENGARVDAFVDGALVCSSTVAGGNWSCTGPVGPGQRTVQAIQWDPAGNPSGATPGILITVSSGASTPPRPIAPAPGPGTPPRPSPGPTQSPTPNPTPAPSTRPEQGFPLFPPPIGGDSGLPPLDTWGTPTDYGAAIPAAWTSLARGNVLLGLALGIGFIVLIALPVRLLASALRGRIRRVGHRLAGRNSATAHDDSPILNPWVTAGGALAASVLLAALAGGIQSETRYLRLAIAIGIALAVLNGVGIALAAKLSGRALGWAPALRLVPFFLVVAALSALISRGGGIQPPIIVGAVIAVAASSAPRSTQGVVALAQLGALTALALAGWLAHSALGSVEGFWLSLASETLAALCIASLGSVMLLLLPVSGMPGQLLYEWSRLAWVGVALVAATVAATVVAASASFPLALVLALSLGFATLALATWSWIRFVEPQLLSQQT
ncbi:MAG: hypothetical protein JWP85_88 [Rhodoglobus sp.]|nr:hypothetical protein [Rhodoglobus sp.]